MGCTSSLCVSQTSSGLTQAVPSDPQSRISGESIASRQVFSSIALSALLVDASSPNSTTSTTADPKSQPACNPLNWKAILNCENTSLNELPTQLQIRLNSSDNAGYRNSTPETYNSSASSSDTAKQPSPCVLRSSFLRAYQPDSGDFLPSSIIILNVIGGSTSEREGF